MLDIKVKKFHDFTLDELYAILKLRNEVFVIEQNCNYLDTDDKDQIAHHIVGYKDNKIVAYTRIFKPGDYFEEASIGRVLVAQNQRKHGYGYRIVKESIDIINEKFNTPNILISAQLYLTKFYGDLGFKTIGEEYLDCDIPHIKMLYK